MLTVETSTSPSINCQASLIDSNGDCSSAGANFVAYTLGETITLVLKEQEEYAAGDACGSLLYVGNDDISNELDATLNLNAVSMAASAVVLTAALAYF